MRQISCLLLFLLGSFSVWTQSGNTKYPVFRYRVRDGLVAAQVLSMYQDKTGNIWTGTPIGACSFDGLKFETDSVMPRCPIRAMQQTQNGTLLVATNCGLFAKNTSAAYTISILPNFKELANVSGTNHFYAATLHEIYEVDLDGGEWSPLLTLPLIRQLFYEQARQRLWVVYGDANVKIGYWEACEWHPDILQKEEAQISLASIPSENYPRILTQSHIYSAKDTSVLHSFDTPFIGTSPIFDVEGNLYYADLENIWRYSPTTKKSIHILQGFIFAKTLLFDRERNLWAGGENGICRILLNNVFDMYDYALEQGDYIWGFVQDKNQRIWMPSLKGMLYNYTEKEGFQHYLSSDPLLGDASRQGFLGQPFHTSQGKMLFPTNKDCIAFDGTNFSSFWDKRVSVIHEDEAYFIIGGTSVSVKDKNTQQEKIFTMSEMGVYGACMLATPSAQKDEYWLGWKGLAKVNVKTGDYSLFSNLNRKLPVSIVSCGYKDAHNTNWFGSPEGLLYYNAEKDSMIRVSRSVISEPVMFLLALSPDTLLLGMTRTLGILDLKQFHQDGKIKVLILNQYDGYLGEDVAQNGAFKDKKGQVWISASNGIIRFDPRKLPINQKRPLFTTIDRLLSRSNETPGFQVHYGHETQPIRLAPNQRNYRLEYHAVFHTAPEDIQYMYFMEGLDKTWSRPVRDRYVEYTNLPAGEYTFKVKGIYRNLESPETSISFVVEPFYYETWWFRLLLLGAFAVLIRLAISRWVKLNLKRQKQRNAYLALQLRSLTSRIDDHFIRNYLGALQALALKSDGESRMLLHDRMAELSKWLGNVLQTGVELSVPLWKEYDFTAQYVKMEQTRNPNIRYEIEIGKEVALNTLVPRTIIQTFVNNAIRHGLELRKTKTGSVEVKVNKEDNFLKIEIQDNGVGRAVAKEYRKQFPSHSTGKGLELLDEMIAQINLKKIPASYYEIVDLWDETGQAAGTLVKVFIAL